MSQLQRLSPMRTMAEVMEDEAAGCRCELPREKGHYRNCPIWDGEHRRP